jgi:hypothetical protein
MDMRRAGRLPFFVSAALSLPLGLLGLRALDRAPASPARPLSPLEAAYVDARADVAHGGSVAARAAEAAVRWLRAHQYSEGMWSARSFTQMCEQRVCGGRGGDEHDTGVTALAVLALLESGLPRAKFEEPARRGLAWLARRQDASGCLGPQAGKYMYGHAIATLAFARAYPTLGEGIYKHHAARGVRFLEMARNPGLGWRYGVRDGENDASVTAWAAAALAAAASSEVGIEVEPYAFEGARRWLAEVTGERHYEVSYRRRGGGSASVPGSRHERNEGLTAMALWARLGLPGADRARPELAGAAKRLGWSLPVWSEDGSTVDFAAWHAGARALEAWGDRELWTAWSGRVTRLLVAQQRRFNEGCRAGSWDPVDAWGAEGGRVYATAMNLLTLGLVHRAAK